MQPYDISMKFWGIPNSNMFSVYIHLSQQVQADAYRDAKGMGNGNGNTVINPLACRCVDCGRLIQSGSLCEPCSKTRKISEENAAIKAKMESFKKTAYNFLYKGIFTVIKYIYDFEVTKK